MVDHIRQIAAFLHQTQSVAWKTHTMHLDYSPPIPCPHRREAVMQRSGYIDPTTLPLHPVQAPVHHTADGGT